MPKRPKNYERHDLRQRCWSADPDKPAAFAQFRTIPIKHDGKVFLVTLTAAGSPSLVARLRNSTGGRASVPDREILWRRRGGTSPADQVLR
jgi:hypothetical protein